MLTFDIYNNKKKFVTNAVYNLILITKTLIKIKPMAGLESMIVDEKPTPVDREKVVIT